MRVFNVQCQTAAMILLLAAFQFNQAASGQTIGTAFTYQGELEQNGQPAAGTFAMEFLLWDAPTGGNLLGSVAFTSVAVTNGRFSREIDFGADVFNGDQLWLELEVANNILSPRQRITAAPYATATRGMFVSNNESFIGFGRDFPLNATETVGIYDNTSGFSGMVYETDAGGSPYYGYATNGSIDARHFVNGVTGDWHLEVDGTNQVSVDASTGFVGIRRDQRVNASEVFGIGATATSGFRGVYMQTTGENANPYFGYAAGNEPDAYHYLQGSTGDWKLWNNGERLTVSNEGYVGINRETPVVDESTGQSWFDVQIPSSPDVVGGMYLNSEDVGDRVHYGYATAGVSRAVMSYDGAFNIWRLNIGPSVPDELVVRGDNGRVGISTVNPVALLDVNGSARVATNLEVGISACKPGGGSWSSCSDRRLKKNIDSLEGSLDKLLQVKGVTFEYNDPQAINELSGQRIGVIAQQVEKIFPDWVQEREDGYKTVTFRGFEALTIEAIRELREEKNAQVLALTQDNERLQNHNQSLQEDNQELRDRLDLLEASVQSYLSLQQQ